MVIDNDEGDHFQCSSTLSTPFNALLAPPVCTTHMLGEGYGGHMWAQKWSQTIFCKIVPRPLGVPKQAV